MSGRRKRGQAFGRLIGAVGGLLTFSLLALLFGYLYLQLYLDAPMELPDGGTTVMVVPGDSVVSVAQRLQSQGHLDHAQIFARWVQWTGEHRRIQAGEYYLQPGLTPRGLLDKFVRGEVVLHSVTIIEGWRFSDMRRVLEAHPAIHNTGLSDDEVMAALGAPDVHPEGLFFPDTYRFVRGATDLDLLRQAYRRMERELEAVWSQAADADLPLRDPYELLILASIIEKETGLASERDRVAGVFVRRLQIGMRLQTDPTVIYGLGDAYTGVLFRSQLDADTPYNTYTRHGLPPTPIALPGLASLRAAVNPADGDELYFVATGLGDGSHTFSRTLEEHNRAVALYRQRVAESSP